MLSGGEGGGSEHAMQSEKPAQRASQKGKPVGDDQRLDIGPHSGRGRRARPVPSSHIRRQPGGDPLLSFTTRLATLVLSLEITLFCFDATHTWTQPPHINTQPISHA